MAEPKKKILYINLAEKSAESKLHVDLNPYVGGLASALKLASDLEERNAVNKPFILTAGPLTGFFPGCDRLVALFGGRKRYLDGPFAIELKKAGYSGLVIYNTADTPYYLVIDKEGARFGDGTLLLELSVEEKRTWLEEHEVDSGSLAILPDDYREITNLIAVVVNSDSELEVAKPEILKKTRENLWGNDQVVIVSGSDSHWADRWKQLDFDNRQLLLDSLIANEQTADIYSQIPIAFACLEAVGETRTHEELEHFKQLFV